MTTHVRTGRSNSTRTKAGFRGVGQGRTQVAPPELKQGQVRCPVCRNGAATTDRGYLRRHRDLFGHACHNVATRL